MESVEAMDVERMALSAEAEFEKQVGRRVMRRHGLTLLAIRRRARQMAVLGELTKEMSPAEVRETVLDSICDEDPDVLDAINWDALLAFIEKLIPLILQIIAMFG